MTEYPVLTCHVKGASETGSPNMTRLLLMLTLLPIDEKRLSALATFNCATDNNSSFSFWLFEELVLCFEGCGGEE